MVRLDNSAHRTAVPSANTLSVMVSSASTPSISVGCSTPRVRTGAGTCHDAVTGCGCSPPPPMTDNGTVHVATVGSGAILAAPVAAMLEAGTLHVKLTAAGVNVTGPA